MNFVKTALAAATLVVSAGAASADSVHFDTPRNWTQGTNTYTASNGGTVSVQGGNHSGGTITSLSPYTASWGSGTGIGVCSGYVFYGSCGGDSANDGSGHQIDGYGPDEIVLIDFGGLNVTISAIRFSYSGINYNDYDDDFALLTYDSLSVGSAATSMQTSAIGTDNYESVANLDFLAVSGSLFGIGAIDKYDDFKLRAIYFTVNEEPAPVPLPAAGFLLLGGLGGLAALRRRARA